ncbi:MAG: response regulator [Rhodocyclaceae bacterium]
MSATSILVVDDEPLNLEIISEFLSEGGFDMSMAASGEAAWRLLDAEPDRFDLVILDRMMPGLDGLGLLKRMKADERIRHVPVIMQTAAGSGVEVREGLEAGAYYYLVKPFAPETLLVIVRAALSDRWRWREVAQKMATQTVAVGLMAQAEFAVSSLEEAAALAGLLAAASGEPEAVALGLSELIVNGIEHGNLGIDFAAKAALVREGRWAGEVERRLALAEHAGKRVRVVVARDGADWRVRITDEGAGFDWQPYVELDPARAFEPTGRGIALSRRLAFGELCYHGCGNCVEVRYTAAPK